MENVENGKNTVNDTVESNNKTMEYINNVTKSIINQTSTDADIESNIENEAFILAKKAEYKLKRRCCLYCIIASKHSRIVEACELYKKAGDKFKICNQWKKAGLCYENCSEIKKKLKEKPTFFLKQSYLCFSKIDIGNDSKRLFEKLNEQLEKDEEYFQIGKNHENLAIQKDNKKKYDEAIYHYLQALKFYEKDGKHESLKINIEIKLVELMLTCNYPDASKRVPQMLEDIGINYLKNLITRYAAKYYFGKAVLCHIYYKDNPSEGEAYIKKYKKMDKTFNESSIYKLCKDVINSLENNDYKKLKNAIHQYREVAELEGFMEDILNKISEKMKMKNKIIETMSNCNSNDMNNDQDD